MIILTIRTDKPESEIGLYEDNNQISYEKWYAHRELAETLHYKINTMLKDHNKTWANIEGIIIYRGPGSFTGVRIGISVANALSFGCKIPIIGSEAENWITEGSIKLLAGNNDKQVMPFYGAGANITTPKK